VSDLPYVTIVLPTYNRKDKLLQCLQSLERQTYPFDYFDVIVVDDGSTDGTTLAVENFMKASHLRLSFCSQNHSGPGAARNLGSSRAIGDLLAFTEDDIVADPQWLENASKYFSSHEIAALEGKTVLGNSAAPGRILEKGHQLGFLPCNLFIRKEVFLEVHGFDPEFFDGKKNVYFREDADFGFRVHSKGSAIVRAENVVVVHPDLYSSIRDYFEHARRYFFDPLLYKKHPKFYRQFIEVKSLGPFRIHRPFHYLCWIFVVSILIILTCYAFSCSSLVYPSLIIALASHVAIRYRYERKVVPEIWKIPRTLAFLLLPFYYWYWFMLGCSRFKSWGAVI